MPRINKFDGTNLPTIRAEIDAALKDIGKRHGVSLKMGNIRYTDTTFSGKIEAAIAENGSAGQDPNMIKYAADYKKWAPVYGWPVALLNSGSVVYGGKRYTIIGYNTRGRAYPIIARSAVDKKVYKLPIAAVQSK